MTLARIIATPLLVYATLCATAPLRAGPALGDLEGAAGRRASDVYVPPVGNPVCGYCSRPLPCGCYGRPPGRPPGDDDTPPVDIAEAPIVTFPVGIVGGLIGGGIWWGQTLAGDYPDEGLLANYAKFFDVPDGSPGDSALEGGLRTGGAPWLLLYFPCAAIKAGVVTTADGLVSLTESPPPPNPQIAVNESIARTYADLAEELAPRIRKAESALASASAAKTAWLDGFISSDAGLSSLFKTSGLAAAREKAKAKLEVMARMTAQQRRNARDTLIRMQDRDAECQKAVKKFADSAKSFAVDAFIDKNFPKWVGDAKGMAELELNSAKLYTSYKEATTDGGDWATWMRKPETRETLDSIGTGLLGFADSVGIKASAAVAATDLIKADVAILSSRANYRRDRELLGQIAASTQFTELQADDWTALCAREKAAATALDVLRNRSANYSAKSKEYEAKAASFRR